MDAEFNTADEDLIRRYLLGDLPEHQRDSVEARLFGNDLLWEHLCVVEDDLIDRYVRGELTRAEQARFDSHFLSSPRRRERVAMARVWLAPRNQASPGRWTAALRSIFAARNWILVPAAAACVALVGWRLIGWTAELSRLRNETAQLRREIRDLAETRPALPGAPNPAAGAGEGIQAEIQRQLRSLAAALPKAAALSFVLLPGVQRAAGQPPQRIVIPPGVGSIQLELPLSEIGPYTDYRAVIERLDGTQVFGADRLRAARTSGGALLRMTAPANALAQGDYRVLVYGHKAGGELEELSDYFAFQVGPGAF